MIGKTLRFCFYRELYEWSTIEDFRAYCNLLLKGRKARQMLRMVGAGSNSSESCYKRQKALLDIILKLGFELRERMIRYVLA